METIRKLMGITWIEWSEWIKGIDSIEWIEWIELLEKHKNARYARQAPQQVDKPPGLEFLLDSPPATQAPRCLDKYASARIALDQQI